MERYIDAEKLKTKIEKRKNILSVESPFGIGGRIELELVLDTIVSLQKEEQPEYGYLSTEYVHGKKSRWNVGDVLAQYVCTSNEEGEYPIGKIINVEFDEEDGWVYTFEDESVWDEQSLVEEEFYKKN